MTRLTFILFLGASYALWGQQKEVTARYISEEISIDASLDEASWESATAATNFWQYFPTDTIQAKSQTEIKFLYNDKTLYVGIKVQTEGNDYIVPSLRRDFRAGGNDNVTLMFDTFNDGTNAFLFGSNPEGVLREALVSGGGTDLRGFTTSWDTKWVGETQQYEGYYICEWAIPFSAFKYQEGETRWRFNSYQFDTQGNERNTWMQIPQNQFIFNLAYMGDLIFEKPLGASKSPISIIPYVNGLLGKDYEDDKDASDFKIGGDAKLTIGSSLNLDLTFNPDFSQVEADNLVTNLTRFEINLPERRQFFIENNDLFANFGDSRGANPFFSRRIGIAQDTSDITIENDIIAGVRLSGKLTNDFRIGILNIQTTEDEDNEIGSNNNTVLALQHKLFSRSNIGLVFINRQNTSDAAFINPENEYNRVVGLDYNLANKDNSWNGKAYLHKSFSPGIEEDDVSGGLRLEYNNKGWRLLSSNIFVGESFNSDLGFIPRKDIIRNFTRAERLLFPKKGRINRHIFSLSSFFVWRPGLDFQLGDRVFAPRWQAELKNTSNLEAVFRNRYTYLFDSFDPSRSDEGLELPANSEYRYNSIELNFRSDTRKTFSFSFRPTYGEFFNGNIFTFQSEATLRLQPKFIFGLRARYDNVNLPAPFSDNQLWLISPRAEITFSKSLFWNTLVQFSSQSSTAGINSRLQWRFAPLSDLFLVYNDNYTTEDVFAPRFRSINLKVTYWLYL
ncbi:MAG: carbohydrate binding family 9 domain-containing protein [Bacteroidetes bacterium]|nr:carbohydrate binding family 9 domain-containing protein [Bacteroidota bacterium]